MRSLAIEISSAGLVVVGEAGVVHAEPAFAAVDGNKILTGTAAYAQARLNPRNTSRRHWAQLSVERGSSSVPGVGTTAELAFAQLESVWARVGDNVDNVVFVVPSTFEGEALGILLGLAEECGVPVGAIVDAAVAASDRAYPGMQLVYVDAGLGSVYVTPLEQGDRVTAEQPAVLGSIGLGGLMDAFARRVGELFVLETRFDPFHEAVTEQLVYDGLPDVIRRLDRGEKAAFALTHRDEVFEIEIEPDQVLGAAQGFYRAVRQLIAQNRRDAAGLVVQLSDRLVALPGIEAELSRLDAATLVELKAGHAGLSVLAGADALAIDPGSVTFYRHMPWRGEPVEIAAPGPAGREPVAAESRERPTHVVYRGIAYPINGEGVVIGRTKPDQRAAIVVESDTQGVSRMHCELAVVDGELRLRDLSSYGTFVNERRIEGDEVLKLADTIRVGSPGAELIVIRLEDSDGT